MSRRDTTCTSAADGDTAVCRPGSDRDLHQVHAPDDAAAEDLLNPASDVVLHPGPIEVREDVRQDERLSSPPPPGPA